MPIPSPQIELFISVINILGLFAFAVSGAVAALKRQADIVGVLILAVIASSCGGIYRDILIGDLPPVMLRSHLPLAIALASGAVTFFCSKLILKMNHPIDYFDAIGLGLFCVTGANKALIFHISPIWSIVMGILTGVGGGMTRDMMLARVPTLLRSEIYITAALLGSAIMVIGKTLFPAAEALFMTLGAFACSGLRCLAIHYRWHVHR